jgi:hypothetical protein
MAASWAYLCIVGVFSCASRNGPVAQLRPGYRGEHTWLPSLRATLTQSTLASVCRCPSWRSRRSGWHARRCGAFRRRSATPHRARRLSSQLRMRGRPPVAGNRCLPSVSDGHQNGAEGRQRGRGPTRVGEQEVWLGECDELTLESVRVVARGVERWLNAHTRASGRGCPVFDAARSTSVR